MNADTWNTIESILEDINIDAQDIIDDESDRNEMAKDILRCSDRLYSICEEEYATGSDIYSGEYEDIFAMLPDTHLSVEEHDSLCDAVNQWRKDHGYPEV